MGFPLRWQANSSVRSDHNGVRQASIRSWCRCTSFQCRHDCRTKPSRQPSTDQPVGHPFRWLLVLLACGAMFYGLFVSYGPDILRDHRLAGTWQPAYDLRATEGKCERTNFVITRCSAKINSVAKPDQAPIAHSFLMLFSGGGGEALVPVRSTIDRSGGLDLLRSGNKALEPYAVVCCLGGHSGPVRFRCTARFFGHKSGINSFRP